MPAVTPAAAPPFRCRGCSACCRWPGYVLLTAADIAALAGALDMDEAAFIRDCTVLAANRAQLSLAEQPGGACCLLTAGGRCRAYAARPQQCRDFPHRWRVAGCPALAEG